jgi:general stress protein 26
MKDSSMTQNEKAPDYEELAPASLDDDVEARLLKSQTECAFIWANREGWAVGLTMSFLFTNGSFWLTTSGQRKRVSAVRRDPRVSIVVSSLGSDLPPMKTVTYKGLCTVHEDRAITDWFLPAFAANLGRGDKAWQEAYIAKLDTPRRVILEVVPQQRIGFDGDKLYQGADRWDALDAEDTTS